MVSGDVSTVGVASHTKPARLIGEREWSVRQENKPPLKSLEVPIG